MKTPNTPDTQPAPAPPTPTLLLAVARLAACAAGDHAFANRARRHEAKQVARHDIKHVLDLECEAIAGETIRRAFPDHAILGEESAANRPAALHGMEWVIDPIDGTINFFHGLPLWCCSVAARHDGVSLAGVVYAPALGLCFEAACDGPARCNGVALQVSETAQLAAATVHTGGDKSEDPARAFRFFTRIASAVQRPRMLGTAALDICFVAAGQADAYFEHGVYLWDIAAAGLIVTRAGGQCEILRQEAGCRMAVMASNGRLHAPLRELILGVL